MAEVQTSEMGAKLTPVSLGLSTVKFGNHGSQFIVVSQLNPYLYNNGSHTLTHSLTTVTVVGDVTMETNVHLRVQLIFCVEQCKGSTRISYFKICTKLLLTKKPILCITKLCLYWNKFSLQFEASRYVTDIWRTTVGAREEIS
jgi:hypothetical protein